LEVSVSVSVQKANRIVSSGLGLLEREIVLPGLVWRDAGGDFAGAGGDTVTLAVPARGVARTRTLRGARPSASEGDGIITMDDLTETKVDVTLDTDVYNAVGITDEQSSLDIVDFGAQVLMPQVRAVAEGAENALAARMVGATYNTNLTLDTSDPYKTFVDGHVALGKANVPLADRFAVVGADIEGIILKSDHLSRVDQSGSDSALRQAQIGTLARFPVYVTNALPSNVGFLFHRTAFVLSMKAPRVPQGATVGASRSDFGLALRWLMDYDFRNQQDRSIVNTYIGTNVVADSADEAQTVTITGSPTGGTFTLTYSGQTTAAIAYNAAAGTVQSRLEALSNLGTNRVSATGSAGGPYTVSFRGGLDVAQMTATSSLTGGSSPAVTVTTAVTGGSTGLVRAVKILAS
jgi:hypothetical protein